MKDLVENNIFIISILFMIALLISVNILDGEIKKKRWPLLLICGAIIAIITYTCRNGCSS